METTGNLRDGDEIAGRPDLGRVPLRDVATMCPDPPEPAEAPAVRDGRPAGRA